MNIKRDRRIIYLAGFLFSISIALASYLNSSLLSNYINKNYIGIVYMLASFFTVLGLLRMPKVLTKLGNRKTILLSLSFIFISLLTLSLGKSVFFIIPAFVLYFASISFIITSLDIFIRDFSKESSIGSARGTYLMIINLAWIVSQIISGSLINKASFSGIYLLGAGFAILVSLVFLFSLKDFKDPEYKKISIKKTVQTFMNNKHLSRIYIINLILQFFYAWMVIYTPIYLHEYAGFGWDKIGIMFSIMLIPFVLVDLPLGKLSDKIGEKEMLITGFFVIIISVFLIPYIESVFLIWAIILFLTRVGAATIEVMSESYFFKVVDEEDADEISFFRNTSPVAYIIAPLLAVPILLLVPSFGYLFFILSAILLGGLLIALRLEDIK